MELESALGQKSISGQLNKIITKLIEDKLIEHTIPDNINHPAQRFQLTEREETFLKIIEQSKR